MTQKELAKCIYRNAKYIGHIEQGTETPSLETRVIITNTLNVTFDQLLYGSLENCQPEPEMDLNELLGALSEEEKKRYVELIRFLIERNWK